jgi:hypothetical protein
MSEEVLIRVPTPSTPLVSILEEEEKEASVIEEKGCICPNWCGNACYIWNIVIFGLIVLGLFVGFLKIVGVF